MEPAELVIIGGGWRAEFFLRVARELPDQFVVRGMFVRDAVKAARLTASFGVPTYQNLDELFAQCRPLFAVVSVRGSATVPILTEVAKRGIPILCETPPAPDLAGLIEVNALTAQGARIQIAEQYIYQPMHAARLAVARSGLLGTVSQSQVSFTQGYHGISLLRHYLGVTFETVKITARRFESPIIKGPDRVGPPREDKIIPCPQTIAWFDFGNQLGVFDFAHDQHRSYIRSDRILVRGERGEINQSRVRHLLDYKTPMTFDLQRLDAGIDGNLEGYYHKAIVGGGQYWYQNPFPTARLADDELAVATCMGRMADYARGGAGFYSLAEASHDQYLSLMMERSIQENRMVEAIAQPWMT